MFAGELQFWTAACCSANVGPVEVPRNLLDLDDATLDEFADVIETDAQRLV